jgi:hypothetical protein
VKLQELTCILPGVAQFAKNGPTLICFGKRPFRTRFSESFLPAWLAVAAAHPALLGAAAIHLEAAAVHLETLAVTLAFICDAALHPDLIDPGLN